MPTWHVYLAHHKYDVEPYTSVLVIWTSKLKFTDTLVQSTRRRNQRSLKINKFRLRTATTETDLPYKPIQIHIHKFVHLAGHHIPTRQELLTEMHILMGGPSSRFKRILLFALLLTPSPFFMPSNKL